MTARPAPQPEPAFASDLFADRRDTRRAHLWLAVALTIAVAVVCFALWWFDRVADLPSLHPTIQPRASWLDEPLRRERALANLEQPVGGRP